MDHPLRVIHGYELTGAEAETLGRAMAQFDTAELGRVPGFPRRRADSVPGAGLLLTSSVRHLEPERVVFSATGIREGRVFTRLDPDEQAQDPLLVGTAALGAFANRNAPIGQAMVRFTDGILPDESPFLARLRRAVCHVADSAWRDHPEARARAAFLRLVQYPFLGISHVERAILSYAVLVRYAGDRADPAIKRILALAGDAELRYAQLLGELLDLAFRVSGGVPEIADACRLRPEAGLLRLEARHSAVLAADESIRARLRTLATSLGLEQYEIRAG
jgi:exopolyphosphatase/guanosine-5'-triphosphate,3'-diphosphate pyrophosphatase